MSASEKLKALQEALGEEDDDVGIPLPQIVAVVEAAESMAATHQKADLVGEAPDVTFYVELTFQLDGTLAALDEALS